jgi:cytochrome P450
LPKHPSLNDFLEPLAVAENIVSMSGPVWKKWRGLFNPGFAAGHILTLVPGIVDDSQIFANILAKHAENGDVFLLEEAATRLTVDIIGRVVL